MKQTLKSLYKLRLIVGRSKIVFGASWLMTFPLGVWAIGTFHVSILAAFLNPIETWTLAVIIGMLSVGSLMGHVEAHRLAAKIVGNPLPDRIPLYPLADAAQVWPAAKTAWREVLVALAGPLASLVLAVVAYLLWNAQLHPYLNTVTLFLVFFNTGLAIINLAPAFPLDGGRLLRASMWGLLKQPVQGIRLGQWLGFLLAGLLGCWGVFLIAQQARFSLQTGVATILTVLLMLLPLLVQPVWQWKQPEPPKPSKMSMLLFRAPVFAGLVLGLLAMTLALVPTNNGLEAPGIAPSVEPMVQVPPQYHHPASGSLLLTTVFLQTPITAGQWLVGQLSPIINLVPPERIVPADTTAQEVAQRNFDMLDNSEIAAIAIGLQLAGFNVEITGLGAGVTSIFPESPANGSLQPGDIIVGIDGEPVGTVADLIGRLKAQPSLTSIRLQIERAGNRLDITTDLMPPTDPSQPPRIGITVEEAGFNTQLPFPVQIVPQKIAGGPSAGLMFALAVYNAVTPDDLTQGRIIAGTGTINLDGTVGPIGGVQQKVAGAELAGAEYFLSPPENFADAQAAARNITVVEIATAAEAIRFLQKLPPLE